MNEKEAINKILNTPTPTYTKEEATSLLQELGVLDQNGEVIPALKGIIVKVEEKYLTEANFLGSCSVLPQEAKDGDMYVTPFEGAWIEWVWYKGCWQMVTPETIPLIWGPIR